MDSESKKTIDITILAKKPIRLLALVGAVAQILVMPYLMVLIPAHFVGINDSVSMGLLWSAFALGMMLSGMAMAKIGTTNKARLWVITMVIYTLAFAGMAYLQSTPFVLLGNFLAGIGSGLHGPISTVTVTEEVEEKLRGRAFSLFSAVQMLAAPVGLAFTTALLGWGTSIYTLAVGFAVAWMLGAAWAAWAGARVFRV